MRPVPLTASFFNHLSFSSAIISVVQSFTFSGGVARDGGLLAMPELQ
jgi:hypothetical protein